MPEDEGLREKGHLGNQGVVVSLHFGVLLGRLKQPAGAARRLEQPGAGNQSWEVEEKGQPRLLGEAQTAESFCAALRNLSFGESGMSLSLHQTFGRSNHWERGVVWGTEEEGLGAHGTEEGPLQRHGGVGM